MSSQLIQIGSNLQQVVIVGKVREGTVAWVFDEEVALARQGNSDANSSSHCYDIHQLYPFKCSVSHEVIPLGSLVLANWHPTKGIAGDSTKQKSLFHQPHRVLEALEEAMHREHVFQLLAVPVEGQPRINSGQCGNWELPYIAKQRFFTPSSLVNWFIISIYPWYIWDKFLNPPATSATPEYISKHRTSWGAMGIQWAHIFFWCIMIILNLSLDTRLLVFWFVETWWQ